MNKWKLGCPRSYLAVRFLAVFLFSVLCSFRPCLTSWKPFFKAHQNNWQCFNTGLCADNISVTNTARDRTFDEKMRHTCFWFIWQFAARRHSKTLRSEGKIANIVLTTQLWHYCRAPIIKNRTESKKELGEGRQRPRRLEIILWYRTPKADVVLTTNITALLKTK